MFVHFFYCGKFFSALLFPLASSNVTTCENAKHQQFYVYPPAGTYSPFEVEGIFKLKLNKQKNEIDKNHLRCRWEGFFLHQLKAVATWRSVETKTLHHPLEPTLIHSVLITLKSNAEAELDIIKVLGARQRDGIKKKINNLKQGKIGYYPTIGQRWSAIAPLRSAHRTPKQ